MDRNIEFAYQPAVNLETRQPLHFEMLARMRGDVSGRRHRQLIANSEHWRITYLIDQTALRTAEKVLLSQPDDQLRLAINVSATTINMIGRDYLAMLVTLPFQVRSRITLEITATAPVDDLSDMDRFVDGLEHSDVALTLDDLGTGHFSPMEIRRWRPTYVKLDGAIAEQLLSHETREFEMIRRAADEVDARLIAEWVDTQDKIDILKQYEVLYGQGHYLGQPGPLPNH